MRPPSTDKAQRLVWAKLLVEQCVVREQFGKVTFYFESGLITKAEKFEVALPALPEKTLQTTDNLT